jgi:hypothetical protein
LIAGARWAMRNIDWRRPGWVRRVPPSAIGIIASFWFIERVAAF